VHKNDDDDNIGYGDVVMTNSLWGSSDQCRTAPSGYWPSDEANQLAQDVHLYSAMVMCAESLDEDWEKDFDVEVTEQELHAAKERLKNAAAVNKDDVDAGKVCDFLLLQDKSVCCLMLTLLEKYG